jgi:hypothetical protein
MQSAVALASWYSSTPAAGMSALSCRPTRLRRTNVQHLTTGHICSHLWHCQ